MTKKEFIYTITCTVNGKVYVGRTCDADRRKKDHFRSLRKQRHFNKYLQSSYNKHGEASMVFEVIEETTDADVRARELHHFVALKENGIELYNHLITDSTGGVDSKSAKTREFIFDVLDIKYWCHLSTKDTATRFGLSTATVIQYTHEWELLRGRKMIRQVQTERTLEKIALFVERYRQIGRDAYRNLDDFKLSHQAIVKHLPKFGLTFDDVRLDHDFKSAGDRAIKAIASYESGVDMKTACKENNVSIPTFYKYRGIATQ